MFGFFPLHSSKDISLKDQRIKIFKTCWARSIQLGESCKAIAGKNDSDRLMCPLFGNVLNYTQKNYSQSIK